MKMPDHDTGLFAALCEAAWMEDDSLRAGKMFGCPTLFAGRRAVGGVFGDRVTLKLPPDRAAQLIAAGEVGTFAPGGRPMGGWITIADPDDAPELVTEAVRFRGGG